MPAPLQNEIIQIIRTQSDGIVRVWNCWIERSVKYITFTNAGGIIAMLTFMNSRNIRAISWSGLALCFFVFGLVLVGFIIGGMFKYTKDNHTKTRSYTKDFYTGTITWGYFIDKINKLTETNKSALWLGWFSGCCFFIGLIIGILSYVSYDC